MMLNSSETDRVKALRSFNISPSVDDDLHLDELTRLAAMICGSPAALLGFTEGDHQWFKARYRWKVDALPSQCPFVSQVLTTDQVLVVEDTLENEMFRNDRRVQGEPHIRFFAAAPLLDPDGFVIGSLSVFDQKPHQMTTSRISALRALADQAMQIFSLRRELATVRRQIAQGGENVSGLQAQVEQTRELFETATDLILSLDPKGRIAHANRALHETLGFESAGSSGMTITDLVHPNERETFSRELAEIVRTGQAHRLETVFLTISGRRKTFEGNLIPKVIDGETVLIRAIFRDVTERKLMEVELGQARDAALEAARLKSQFLTNITHEIRTPMHVIFGMLDLLAAGEITHEQKDLIQTAQASGEELLTLINNIVHMSALESGRLHVTMADFDLESTVERLIQVMQVVGQEKNLKVSLSLDRTIPAVLRGDVSRLRQILTNLVSNAIRFTEEGGVEVSVRADRETETHLLVRFEVRDTGPGIDPATMKRIFEPFVQGDATSTRSHHGMGLGLAIARQLADLMHGAIGVDSQPGEGSQFWLTIPFEKVITRDYMIAARKRGFAGVRLLIHDRSEISRRITTHYLDSWKVRWREASNSGEVLERLKSEAALGEPYPVLLYDLHADLKGIDLALAVRDDPEIADTAIVLLAEMGEQLNDEDLRSAGVTAYLVKPVEQAELFDVLSAVLARRDPRSLKSTGTGTQSELAAMGVPMLEPEKVRILLAEDKPLNQKLTMSQLARLGYRADVVGNGVQVLQAVERVAYDIILMDCQMPLKDGYDATIEIRKREGKNRKIRIIAMTAHALEGERERCLAVGMDDYLSKPTRQEDLARVLSQWIRRPASA